VGGGGGAGGGPGVSLISGSDQKRRYLNQSRVNPAGLKNIYQTLPQSSHRAENDIYAG